MHTGITGRGGASRKSGNNTPIAIGADLPRRAFGASAAAEMACSPWAWEDAASSSMGAGAQGRLGDEGEREEEDDDEDDEDEEVEEAVEVVEARTARLGEGEYWGVLVAGVVVAVVVVVAGVAVVVVVDLVLVVGAVAAAVCKIARLHR